MKEGIFSPAACWLVAYTAMFIIQTLKYLHVQRKK